MHMIHKTLSFGVTGLLLFAGVAQASVMTDAGCAVKVTKQTDESYTINEVGIDSRPEANPYRDLTVDQCVELLRANNMSVGAEVVIEESEQRAIARTTGSTASFWIPVGNSTGSMGSDEQVYGGGLVYLVMSTYAASEVNPSTTTSDSNPVNPTSTIPAATSSADQIANSEEEPADTDQTVRSLQLRVIELLQQVLGLLTGGAR